MFSVVLFLTYVLFSRLLFFNIWWHFLHF
jgi:hypothetical protein